MRYALQAYRKEIEYKDSNRPSLITLLPHNFLLVVFSNLDYELYHWKVQQPTSRGSLLSVLGSEQCYNTHLADHDRWFDALVDPAVVCLPDLVAKDLIWFDLNSGQKNVIGKLPNGLMLGNKTRVIVRTAKEAQRQLSCYTILYDREKHLVEVCYSSIDLRGEGSTTVPAVSIVYKGSIMNMNITTVSQGCLFLSNQKAPKAPTEFVVVRKGHSLVVSGDMPTSDLILNYSIWDSSLSTMFLLFNTREGLPSGGIITADVRLGPIVAEKIRTVNLNDTTLYKSDRYIICGDKNDSGPECLTGEHVMLSDLSMMVLLGWRSIFLVSVARKPQNPGWNFQIVQSLPNEFLTEIPLLMTGENTWLAFKSQIAQVGKKSTKIKFTAYAPFDLKAFYMHVLQQTNIARLIGMDACDEAINYLV